MKIQKRKIQFTVQFHQENVYYFHDTSYQLENIHEATACCRIIIQEQ